MVARSHCVTRVVDPVLRFTSTRRTTGRSNFSDPVYSGDSFCDLSGMGECSPYGDCDGVGKREPNGDFEGFGESEPKGDFDGVGERRPDGDADGVGEFRPDGEADGVAEPGPDGEADGGAEPGPEGEADGVAGPGPDGEADGMGDGRPEADGNGILVACRTTTSARFTAGLACRPAGTPGYRPTTRVRPVRSSATRSCQRALNGGPVGAT